jgi:hypothetical protein
MLAALKWLEDHAPEGILNAQVYSQAQFPRKTHNGTPIIAKINSDLNSIRRHYWEA